MLKCFEKKTPSTSLSLLSNLDSHHHENSETRPHLTREHEGSRRVGLLLLKSKNEKRFLIYVIW